MQNSFPRTRSQSPRISGRFSVLQGTIGNHPEYHVVVP